ncbi:cell division cycle protein 23 homolog [Aplysia californica]|uniref:Cell division cycle protein 23 homolog n=1 Tax=Aplysia californica TaxID=6500 RepID=A0ABM1A1V5_APLCA|nr:cell division cycle protein 23 homolog [Aplysia californica]
MADAEIASLELPKVKADLIVAQRECYARRLTHAAKWAAEMSKALEVKVDPRGLQEPEQAEDFWDEYDAYVLAMSYFDLKEYDRAVHCLRDCQSPKPYFLRLYSLYMSDQKRKADNVRDSNAQLEPFENEVLKILQTELAEKYVKKKLDGYGLYLYGVVLAKLDIHTLAMNIFVESISMEPLNWAAWMELARLISDKEMLMSLKLPQHWIKLLFMAKVYMELQLHDEALLIYKAFMDKGFSQSAYIVAQGAVTYHDMREVDQAVLMFKLLEGMDPYRMENMDIYSNLLYVKEKKSDLAHLAHRCCTINKYCVETCCVIGNYYSLRSQHEKSILYFQRALKLNANYISAWTLMGHEYMAMKNTSAAIQAYRRSIEVDKRDYRAWYGLGQTYEILKMPSYSLYYYRKAQALKPNDSRMVVALGECYQKVERLQEAKKCFWKAHCLGDAQAIALVKLANLYEMLNEKEQAFQAFTEYINQADRLLIHNHEDLSQAYKYLASYHIAHKNWDEAYAAAQKCTEFTETREEAKSMLRNIQTQRGQEEAGPSVSMHIDDSMDSIAQVDQLTGGAARTFGRVTPVNLKFTP